MASKHALKVKPLSENMSEQQQAWFDLYMSHGDGTRAAQEVEYAHPQVAGSKNKVALRKHIQAAVWPMIKDKVPLAAAKMFRLASQSKNEKVQFEACKYIMELAGYTAIQKKEITIKDMTDAEVDSELAQLLKRSEIIEAEIVNT